MPLRVAEHVMRRGPLGRKVRYRVDLHGVSSFGPGPVRTLIRWEWIETLGVEDGAVVATSANDRVTFPSGAFGFAPEDLLAQLETARSITDRGEVIEALLANVPD